jgi:hypothetical protein
MATRKGQTTALAFALHQAQRGRRVVPINNRKKPLIKRWQHDASTDELTIRNWAKSSDTTGFALLTGTSSGVVVIDEDPRNGGNVAELGVDLPRTMKVATPGGGHHYHFASPNGGVRKQELAPGIELLGDGGLATLPGSLHPNGGTYKLVGRKRSLAPLPQALLRRLGEPANGTAALEGSYGQGSRNTALTRLAGYMRQAGASEDELRHGLHTFNEARCEPPLPPEEVNRIAYSIAQRSGATMRAVTHERARREARVILDREALPDLLLPPRTYTFGDYIITDDKPLPYTVAEWHPTGGNGLLIARRKAGKTTLLANLIKSLADGVPFLGRYEVAFPKGRVACFEYEMIGPMFKHWLRALNIANQDRVVPPLHLRGKPSPLHHEDQVVEWLAEHDVKFWLIDPAARAWSGFVMDENSNAQVRMFTDTLDRVKDRAGVADLVVAHHMGVARFAEGEERGRGASRLEDWADANWYYTRDGDKRALWAEGRGVNVGSEHAVDIQFNPTTHELAAIGTRTARREDEAAFEAIAALRAFGRDRPSATEWRNAIPRKYKDDYLIAVKRGWADYEKVGKKHCYYLTEAGIHALERRVERVDI